MLPLFDMMMRAQNGAAMEAMAKQFNLAQEQTAKAMAALMPAFSSGLKRSTTNPYDFSTLMQAAASGNYAKYFEDMSTVFTPQGIADGNSILGQIFGSKEVSRAIAAQAAQMTGVGQEVLKQMLPAMADMLMGGILKQSTGQMHAAGNPFANTPMAGMMQQWLETTGFSPKAKPEPQASLFDNPFTQAMQAMFAVPRPEQPQPAANPFADNPFAKAFQDMMSGSFPGAREQKQETAEPKAAAPEPNQFAEMLNSMFDSGLEVQKNYQKSLESIFETYRPAGADATPKKPENE
ncbi:hypothetical protein DEM27_01700 [Metarhizobium album]|uniref:DUF937 domain-containing protein n=1 Tax=Metarhizobium album TaxID=2182425 RepID=A0A2U2DX82_9HYPH|nr:DUF937 domain-containing protein [Rhizobium album]PWE57934.1 hypothetical protein DEM27_01700 [Rhizobium album]